ncbi:MAG: STAS domain-containing protein [Pseudomonadota bacterium]
MNALDPSEGAASQLSDGKPQLQISFSFAGHIAIVRFAGDLVSQTAGSAFDALVSATNSESKTLIVDLLDIRQMTRAGLRGLVVAAKLIEATYGRMRLVIADADMERQLLDLPIDHLLHLDRSVDVALAALAKPVGDTEITLSHAELICLPTPSREAGQ